MLLLDQYRCFKKSNESPERQPTPEDEDQTEYKEERIILCRKCQNHITSQHHAIEVEGKHQHTFFNPAGFLFEIGCFSLAPGCFDTGTPTTEFAWFKGCSWRYSFCAECQSHLGWQFLPEEGGSFHGLVLNRLTEQDIPA
jgi:hypothetical protein